MSPLPRKNFAHPPLPEAMATDATIICPLGVNNITNKRYETTTSTKTCSAAPVPNTTNKNTGNNNTATTTTQSITIHT
jgi:hypothetical protein